MDSVRGLSTSVLAGIDMSAYRGSLASVMGMDSVRGLSASVLAGIDVSSYRSSLATVMDSVRGLSTSVLAGIDLRNVCGSVPSINGPDIDERPPVHYSAREAARSDEKSIERIHEYVQSEDLAILITFPTANERVVLLSLSQMTAAYRLLHCFEVRLREVISGLMASRFGPDWMRTRVSSKIVALWEEKRTVAERKGFAISDLLDYADFSDYLGIIVQRSNWREVFQPIFGNQKDTEVSFERLQPLRIETMHSRRLSCADAVVLATEVHRLLLKLDRSRLN
jgi:hypothetical protein